MLRLTVTGCGYLGAVHAAAMAELGHDVLGVETDPRRLAHLQRAKAPFFEPGLEHLLRRGLGSGRLRFSAAPSPAELAEAQVHFLAVGTPQQPNSPSADLSFLWQAVEGMAQRLPRREANSLPLVVGKSTVPVGTARQVAERLEGRALLVWNPEFLREGHAVGDTLHPDRLVYGLPDAPEAAARAQELLDQVYTALLAEGVPRLTMNLETSELVKTAANSFLATKISFINAVSTMCAATGADVKALADAMGRDARIGPLFLRAGIGFGGGCLPKDLRALSARAKELGLKELAGLLDQVDAVNLAQRDLVEAIARASLAGDPVGRKVTVLGATFKPKTDDLRDSPAVDIAARLARAGAQVTVCDPKGLDSLKQTRPELQAERDPIHALDGADLVVLATEWEELTTLDPVLASQRVARPVMIDARNALDPERWREAGWAYQAIGR